MEKIIAISLNNKKTYYKAQAIAEEFFDDNGHLAHAGGVIPDGQVVEFASSSETIKHYKNGKLDGLLQVVDSNTGKITLTEEYEDGELKKILDTKDPIKREVIEASKDYLNKGLVFYKEQNEYIYLSDGVEVARCSALDGALVSGAIPDGKIKEFYETAALKTEANFLGGVLEGAYTKFDEFGREILLEHYSRGILEGEAFYYSYPNGAKTKIAARYANGKIEGKKIGYFPSGSIQFTENYSAGRLDGMREAFYENGILSAQENYKKGLYHGARILYYPNGAVWYKEMYVNSQLEGERVAYYITGELYTKERYEHGLLEGIRAVYDKTGTVELQEEYRFGQKVRKRG